MRTALLTLCIMLMTVTAGYGSDYAYISAESMKERLVHGDELVIVDIQVAEEFTLHHLPGSVATYAYPVKSDDERGRIDQAVKLARETGNDVVIVCPRGKGGAKRTYDYMVKQDVPVEKISILEKGIAGWPYGDMLEKG